MGAELEGFFYYLLNFQWFNLLCRHVTVTDEVDNCCVIKLKQFNRQASWGALDRVESEFLMPCPHCLMCVCCVVDGDVFPLLRRIVSCSLYTCFLDLRCSFFMLLSPFVSESGLYVQESVSTTVVLLLGLTKSAFSYKEGILNPSDT